MTRGPLTKDPQARLDYAFDWTAWLSPSETITAATITATPTGLTINPSPHTTTISGGVVTYWLEGGTVAQTYLITCHITTNQGRVDERSDRIAIRDR